MVPGEIHSRNDGWLTAGNCTHFFPSLSFFDLLPLCSNVLYCTFFALLFLPIISTFPLTDLHILFFLSFSVSPLCHSLLIFLKMSWHIRPSSAQPLFSPLPSTVPFSLLSHLPPKSTAYCTVPVYYTLFHPSFYLIISPTLVSILVITTTDEARITVW